MSQNQQTVTPNLNMQSGKQNQQLLQVNDSNDKKDLEIVIETKIHTVVQQIIEVSDGGDQNLAPLQEITPRIQKQFNLQPQKHIQAQIKQVFPENYNQTQNKDNQSINSSLAINIIEANSLQDFTTNIISAYNNDCNESQEIFNTINEISEFIEGTKLPGKQKIIRQGSGNSEKYSQDSFHLIGDRFGGNSEKSEDFIEHTVTNIDKIKQFKNQANARQQQKVELHKKQTQQYQIKVHQSAQYQNKYVENSSKIQYRQSPNPVYNCQIPQKLYSQYQQVLDDIDSFNQTLKNTSYRQKILGHIQNTPEIEELYSNIQKIVYKHIEPRIHPQSKTELGKIMMKNGKFIVCFINITTRKEKIPGKYYLSKYLYQLFHQNNGSSNISNNNQNIKINEGDYCINNDIIAFREGLANLVQNQLNYKFKQQDRKQTKTFSNRNQINLEQYKPHANFSIVAQKDQNSVEHSVASHDSREPLVQFHRQGEQTRKRNMNFDNNLKRNIISSTNNNNNQNFAFSFQKEQQEFQSEARQNSIENNALEGQQKQKKTNQKINMKNNNKKYIPSSRSKSKQPQLNRQTQYKQTPTNKSNRQSKRKSNVCQLVQESDADSRASKETKNKLGSFYHYKLELDRKDHKKSLKQVRTSARLSKKKNYSKSKKSIETKNRKSKQKDRRSKSKIKSKINDSQDSSYVGQQTDLPKQIMINSDDESIEQIVEVDWIKEHLQQINVGDALLYHQFKAMTKNDKKITAFLRSLQQKTEEEYQESQSQKNSMSYKELNFQKGKKNIYQKEPDEEDLHYVKQQEEADDQNRKRGIKIQQLPLTIQEVVDPNINNHGIYALLKLSRLSGIQLGTRFAVTRLSRMEMVNRRHIVEDIQKAKKLVGVSYAQNIGYIQLNQQILIMVQNKSKYDKKNGVFQAINQ